MADQATATATTTDAATQTSGDSTASTAAATADTGAATQAAATAAETAAGTTEGTETLGDAGKKALDAMKAERKAARDEAATAKAERDALQAKLDGKEAEHAAAQEAQKVRDEALAAANERILKAEVRAAAAGKLADPQDALRFLDMSEFEVGKDGEVDASLIAKAIDDLVTTKPYLAAQGGQRFQGGADGGARNGSEQPAQLTDADVKRLYAEKRYDEIEEARKAGRLTKLLGA